MRKPQMVVRLPLLLVLGLAVVLAGARTLLGGPAPEDAFRYTILRVEGTNPGDFPVITFEVTNPLDGDRRYDVLNRDPGSPFIPAPSGTARLGVLVGWDTVDYHNEGSGNRGGAALPISINALSPALVKNNGDNTFTVTSPTRLPLFARGTGVAAMEGHPSLDLTGDGIAEAIPVKSAYAFFPITDLVPVPRRAVVDVDKCKACHVPHLSLHGGNRTDEVQVCVICHNPNQTDISQRTSGLETPVDFKHMVHAIHAGKRRRTPYVVIGFQGSVNDFSGVRFPAELSNCLNCHKDETFALPLRPGVLGTTIFTGSTYATATTPKIIDTDPANDLNITPIASVCSACHDRSDARKHMISKGAKFGVLQSDIDRGLVREQCVRCHGPGGKKDITKVHEIGKEGDDD